MGLSDTALNIVRWLREAYPDGEVRVIERVPAAVVWVRIIDESFHRVPVEERCDILFERLRKISGNHENLTAIYGLHVLVTPAEFDEAQTVLRQVREISFGGGSSEVEQLLRRACDVLQFESATQTIGDSDANTSTR